MCLSLRHWPGALITLCLIIACSVQATSPKKYILQNHEFQQPPQRVVALDWDLLEQVLALDVMPVAAAEVAGYRQWVVNPPAPISIADVGSRAEPNLEKIASLTPDVILAASPQKDLLPLLSQIAPVIYLPNFSPHDNAPQTAIAHFQTLGKLLGKESLAEQKLAELTALFTQLRTTIASHLPTSKDVLVMRFATVNSIFLYTENSTTAYVMEQLGLGNPLSLSSRAWGIQLERINRLKEIERGYVLYVLPFPEQDKLKMSRLWQAFPFVKAGRVNAVRSVWNYGGAMSLGYMAQAITDSLLELNPQP